MSILKQIEEKEKELKKCDDKDMCQEEIDFLKEKLLYKAYIYLKKNLNSIKVKENELRFGAYFRGEKTVRWGVWYKNKLLMTKEKVEKIM